jgi:hypothetical protein
VRKAILFSLLGLLLAVATVGPLLLIVVLK